MTVLPTWTSGISWQDSSDFHRTIAEWLSHCVDLVGPETAVTDSQRTLTWSELADEVATAARRLTALGVKRGDVVVLQLPNWWEAIVISLAVWRIEAVLNPVTPIYRGAELREIFRMARPALVVCPGDFGETDYSSMSRDALATAGISAPVVVVRPSHSEASFFALPERDELDRQTHGGADDVCLLMFTSGTTGRPKGVLHSTRTLTYESWSIARRFSLDEPVVFMPSPLTHITGLLYGLLLPILTTGRVVLQDRWNPDRAVDLIEAQGCTFCVGATPFLVGLIDRYESRRQQSHLAAFVCGGADVPPNVIERAHEVMGTIAVRAYGLTELPTLTCGLPADDLRTRGGDDGVLVGSAVARIVEVEDGIGELEARAPEMFLGYLDPEDNAHSFTVDGWFKTGDLAAIQGNRIMIKGRKKDIICRGGENISPLEVENVLRAMPGITDVAIVGVADSVLGERACAMVVPDVEPPSLREICEFLAIHELAKQKFPEHLLLCGELPRTASGKVQKFLLRKLAEERLARNEGESR